MAADHLLRETFYLLFCGHILFKMTSSPQTTCWWNYYGPDVFCGCCNLAPRLNSAGFRDSHYLYHNTPFPCNNTHCHYSCPSALVRWSSPLMFGSLCETKEVFRLFKMSPIMKLWSDNESLCFRDVNGLKMLPTWDGSCWVTSWLLLGSALPCALMHHVRLPSRLHPSH